MCYHADRGLRGFGCWGLFWPWYMACGISVPSRPQWLKSRILTTGSPGNSWGLSLLLSLNFTMSCSLIWKMMSSISTAHLNQLHMLLIAVVFMVILPGSSAGKESAYNAGDPGSIPGSGRSTGDGIVYPLQYSWASLVAQLVKNLLAMQEAWVRSLGGEDPLEKVTATLQYSGLENSMDCIVHEVAKTRTRLRDFHFHGHPTCAHRHCVLQYSAFLSPSLSVSKHLLIETHVILYHITFLSCIYYSWTLCWL